jgi:hypothetical protein
MEEIKLMDIPNKIKFRGLCVDVFSELVRIVEVGVLAGKNILETYYEAIATAFYVTKPMVDSIAFIDEESISISELISSKTQNEDELKKQLTKNESTKLSIICSLASFINLIINEVFEAQLKTNKDISYFIEDLLYMIEPILKYEQILPKNWISFNMTCFSVILELLVLILNFLVKKGLSIKKNSELLTIRVINILLKFVTMEKLDLNKYEKFYRKIIDDLRVKSLKQVVELLNELKIRDKKLIFPFIEEIFNIYNKIDEEEIIDLSTDILTYLYENELSEDKNIINCESFTLKCIISSNILRIKETIYSKIENKLLKFKDTHEKEIIGFLKRIKELINYVEKISNYSDDQEDIKAEACIKIMNHFLELNNKEIYFSYVNIKLMIRYIF